MTIDDCETYSEEIAEHVAKHQDVERERIILCLAEADIRADRLVHHCAIPRLFSWSTASSQASIRRELDRLVEVHQRVENIWVALLPVLAQVFFEAAVAILVECIVVDHNV